MDNATGNVMIPVDEKAIKKGRRARRASRFIALAQVTGEVVSPDSVGTVYEIAAEGKSVEDCQRKLTVPGTYIFACVHLEDKPEAGGLVWHKRRR